MKSVFTSEKLEALFSKYRAQNIETDGDVFNQQLFEKLTEVEQITNAVKSTRWGSFKIASAFSFVFLILISMIVFFDVEKPEESMELISSTEIEKGEPVKIILEFESDEAIENIEVAFKLDKGVRFYSTNEKVKNLDEYKWVGNFKKGRNEIPFVVSLISEGEWNISTEAKFGGFVHNRRIVIKSGNEKVAVIQYKSKIFSN